MTSAKYFWIADLYEIHKEQYYKCSEQHHKSNGRGTGIVIFLQFRHYDEGGDLCLEGLIACDKDNAAVFTQTSSEGKTEAEAERFAEMILDEAKKMV